MIRLRIFYANITEIQNKSLKNIKSVFVVIDDEVIDDNIF